MSPEDAPTDPRSLALVAPPFIALGFTNLLSGCPDLAGVPIITSPDTHDLLRHPGLHAPRILILIQPQDWPLTLEGCREFLQRHPGTPTLVAIPPDLPEPILARLWRLGLRGFLPLDAEETTWRLAIQTVLQGHPYSTPSLRPRLQEVAEPPARRVLAQLPTRSLRGRKREVLALALEGYAPADIGLRLGLGPRSIRDYLRRLRRAPPVQNALHRVGASL